MPIALTSAFVTLAACDFGLLVEFYSRFLEQEPIALIPNVYAEFQLPNLKLGIFRPKISSEFSIQNSALSPISLCLEVEHLETAINHLTSIGYPPPGEIITASHGREIYAYDPEGNRLILHQS